MSRDCKLACFLTINMTLIDIYMDAKSQGSEGSEGSEGKEVTTIIAAAIREECNEGLSIGAGACVVDPQGAVGHCSCAGPCYKGSSYCCRCSCWWLVVGGEDEVCTDVVMEHEVGMDGVVVHCV
jgi:hypothetical protein